MPVYKNTAQNQKLGRVGKEYVRINNPKGGKGTKGNKGGGAPPGNQNAVKDKVAGGKPKPTPKPPEVYKNH